MYADSSESIRVVIGRVDGTRRNRKNVVRFQRGLLELPNIEVTSTKDFTIQARGMRVDAILPEDSASLTRLCDLLDIDAAIYAHVIKEGRRHDLVVSVYAGENGQFVGEKVLKVSRGRFTRGLWSAAARQVMPLIRQAINMEATQRVAPATAPPVVRRPTRPIAQRRQDLRRRIEEIPVGEAFVPEERPIERSASRGNFFVLYGGAAALSRSYLYTVDQTESAIFAEGGIDYELGFVPGLAVEAVFSPEQAADGGPGPLSFRLAFEKVFFRTQQTVVNNDGSESSQILPSNHLHVDGSVSYQHIFSSGTRLGGFAGGGHLRFTVENNQEYQGATYTYLNLGVSGFVPLGGPTFALDLQGSVLPYASLGDSLEEVGSDATIFGFRAYAGFASQFKFGLALKAGVELTQFSGDVSGEGRDGRVGQSTSDRFIGTRVMMGYRF